MTTGERPNQSYDEGRDGLNSWEVITIGQALVGKVGDAVQEVLDLTKWLDETEVQPPYTDDEKTRALGSLVERARRIHGLACRFVPDPLPWDTFYAQVIARRLSLTASRVREAWPERCPRCNSSAPNLHPAIQHEGEVQLCSHLWHGGEAGQKREAVS